MRVCPKCKTPYTTNVEFCGIDGARLEETDTDPLIGATIDRYRVVERLGGGGMAAVYRAVHTVIDRQCALKILFGELASDRAFSERFRREAQAASRIKHENVVEVLDFGTTPEGASFLLMELLPGRTLGSLISEGPVPPPRAAWIARDVAAGLCAAHAHGFIHRDLKPANIMLVEANGKERAKILDFGLVSSAKKDGEKGELTKTGQTLGTPYYMAPEQIEGGNITERTDLYSLGVIMHEMLAGKRPFTGTLSEILVQHGNVAPPPLPPSGGLEVLSHRLLEKKAAKRPQSAVDVVREIEALGVLPKDAQPLVLPKPPPKEEAPPTRADRPGDRPGSSSQPSQSSLSPQPSPPSPSSQSSPQPSQPSLARSGSGAASALLGSSLAGGSSLGSSRGSSAGSSLGSVGSGSPLGSARGSSASLEPSPGSGASAVDETSAPTETNAIRLAAALRPPPAPVRPLSISGLIGVAVVVVGLGAFIALGGVERVKAMMPQLQDAAKDVGSKAVTAAQLDDPPPEPPKPESTERLARDLDDDVTAALKKRGLTRADVPAIPEVAALMEKFERAKKGDANTLRSAGAALIREIARAPLSRRVVDGVIARVRNTYRQRSEQLGPKTKAMVERKLGELEKRARTQRTEAERGRIVLDAVELEKRILE